MDPRFLRSQAQLRAAVYELAEAGPIAAVTVTKLCRAAGVTRDTFYRHASTPVALLSQMLGEDLVSRLARASGNEATSAIVLESERVLLAHVAAHEAVYRNALTTSLHPELRENFEGFLRRQLIAHTRAQPQILPEGIDTADEESLQIIAAYAASGTVGAIEQWLRKTPLDVDWGARLIIAASPAFWVGPTAI